MRNAKVIFSFLENSEGTLNVDEGDFVDVICSYDSGWVYVK